MASLSGSMRNILRRTVTANHGLLLQARVASSGSSERFTLEPDYLDVKPDIPEYEAVRVQMRAYDYVPLESFTRYAHHFMRRMGVQVELWPVPARTSSANTFHPASTKVKDEYHLHTYERMMEMRNVPSPLLPLIIETIRQNLPEGVNFTVKKPEEEDDEFRFVPDVLVKELEQDIDDLVVGRKKKKVQTSLLKKRPMLHKK